MAMPGHPGLGIEIDTGRVMTARTLYKTLGPGIRDDAMTVQYLVPG